MQHRDEDLLRKVKSSDREAFRLLFERYQPLLFRYLLYRLRDEELIHDIIQETFVRIWTRRASLRHSLPLFPYLARISGNLMRDSIRHRKVELQYAEELRRTGSPAANETEQTVNAKFLEARIRAVVNEELPDRCRLIFLLSRMEEKSNEEIAALLGITIKTVENQITKALRVLRTILTSDRSDA